MITGAGSRRNDKKTGLLVESVFKNHFTIFLSLKSGPNLESPYYYPDITFEPMWKRSDVGWNQEMEDLNPLIFWPHDIPIFGSRVYTLDLKS